MDITYCQGMNSVCSPFLYVMPEVDAFFSFVQFIKTVCPLYWNTDITGAYHGQKLFREILQIVDVELYEYFEKKEFKLEAINLRCILSFNGTTPPIVECLKLWDFFLAFGFHLNILCVVGQVVLMREEIMKSPSPISLLNERAWPSLDAELIKSVCINILRQLDEKLYKQLAEHPFKGIGPKKKFDTLPRNYKSKPKINLSKEA